MTKQKKQLITEMVAKMKQMDMGSVQIIKVGVDVLSAKEAIDAANRSIDGDFKKTG